MPTNASSKNLRTRSNHDPELRQHTKAFLQRWRENLGAPGARWQRQQAMGLYEDLEQLCAMGEQGEAAEITEPALELAVYLCSFVDDENAPNPVQRQGLERLVQQLALATTSGGAVVHRSRDAASGAGAACLVFYLRGNARELPGLAARLGQEGCIVRPFEDRNRLMAALDESSPDVLIVEESFVADVHALTEAAQRKRPTQRDQPLCLVLAESTDRTRTLFAQRAGADAVLTERDPIVLVSRLDELRAHRRARDFRVLIVEDDRSQAKFCDSILRHCGMITCICADATRVSATLNEFKPDLVLLDMYLPEGNGIEVAQRIREQPRHAFLPIVFLTGEHDQDLRFDAIRVGADDFITKPIKPRHLVTAVESRIKRARELHAERAEQRGERRGILSARDVLTREILRVSRDEREYCPALAFIAVDDAEKVAHTIGFVASGILPQQIAAALAAELGGQHIISAWGELRFVALLQAQNELALREMLEVLRRKLDARLWLSADSPIRLHFTLGCVRVPAEIMKIDDLLERVRGLCISAQQAGGARCEFELRSRGDERDEDPRRRLLRSILRAPNLHGTGRLDFQPLVPLSGQIAGQYQARVELVPEKFAHALHLTRADYLPIARELGMVAQADRQCLRALLERLREKPANKHALRIHVQMSADTVFDGSFAPWLAAELRGHRVTGGSFVLVLMADEVHARLEQAPLALESLQRLGLRLGIELHEENSQIAHALLLVESINVVRFCRPSGADDAWNRYTVLFNEARSLGKTVVASDVQRMSELGVLLRLGVHYVQGDVVAPWALEYNFDFAAVV